MKCAVICETFSGMESRQYEQYCSFLLSKGLTVYAVVFNNPALAATLSDYSDYVISVTGAEQENFTRTAANTAGLAVKYGFDSISSPSSIYSDIIIPMTAYRLNVPFIPNITNILFDEKCEFIRKLGSGSSERITANSSKCCFTFGTERLNRFTLKKNADSVYDEIWGEYETDESEPQTQTRKKQIKTKKNPEFNSFLSAGRDIIDGVKYEKNIIPAARKISSACSVSSDAMRIGIGDREKAVGISCRYVSPDVYIAVGDKGSMEHLKAIRSAGYVISINQNSKSRYSYFADLDIKCDIFKFLHRLDEKISKLLKL